MGSRFFFFFSNKTKRAARGVLKINPRIQSSRTTELWGRRRLLRYEQKLLAHQLKSSDLNRGLNDVFNSCPSSLGEVT